MRFIAPELTYILKGLLMLAIVIVIAVFIFLSFLPSLGWSWKLWGKFFDSKLVGKLQGEI